MYEKKMFQAVFDQDEIHRMAWSEDAEEQLEAFRQLRYKFSVLPDKKQACDDLHRITSYNDGKFPVFHRLL